jgi:hypothetical protein
MGSDGVPAGKDGQLSLAIGLLWCWRTKRVGSWIRRPVRSFSIRGARRWNPFCEARASSMAASTSPHKYAASERRAHSHCAKRSSISGESSITLS